MNRNPSGSHMPLSKAITGFLQYKQAENMADSTITSYSFSLKRWLEYEGDKEVGKITSKSIIEYMNWLRTEYQPKRFSGRTHPLSNKTMRNEWITLSSFFHWAHDELKVDDVMADVPAPKFKFPPIETFTKEEMERMLKGCLYARESQTNERRKFAMRRPTANRDAAILLVLADTGLRATELCMLLIGDCDQKTGRIDVKHGFLGGAKGGKGRVVYLGKSARRALWRYLAEREDGEDPNAPLFVGMNDRPMNPNSLRHLTISIGERAGVKNAHPHLFRHFFAINFLRSGGNILTLQVLLGHNSLDMVKHYARVAEVDVEQAHRKSSPVDNMRL